MKNLVKISLISFSFTISILLQAQSRDSLRSYLDNQGEVLNSSVEKPLYKDKDLIIMGTPTKFQINFTEEIVKVIKPSVQEIKDNTTVLKSFRKKGDYNVSIKFSVLNASLKNEGIRKAVEFLKNIQLEKGIKQLHIVGHTDSDPIRGRAKLRFEDNFGLSRSRALSVANFIKKYHPDVKFSYEGRGATEPLQSNNSSWGKAQNRRVDIAVFVGEEKIITNKIPEKTKVITTKKSKILLADLVCQRAAEKKELNRESFLITVDGKDLETGETRSNVDSQRCNDVLLEKSKIQIHYENQVNKKRLNVTVNETDDRKIFATYRYSNYSHFIVREELLLFEDSKISVPVQTIKLKTSKGKSFQDQHFNVKKVKSFYYKLRVYDSKGRYDETQLKKYVFKKKSTFPNVRDMKLRVYGENALEKDNIYTPAGTVTVSGQGVPKKYKTNIMSDDIPVDDSGNFVYQQLLPTGKNYSIGVNLSDEKNKKGIFFKRDLYLPQTNWMYIGIADVTGGVNFHKGDIATIRQDDRHFDSNATSLSDSGQKVYVDGRIAFYVKGKISDKTKVTIQADTGEAPFQDLFSNFLDKDPRVFLERFGDDRHYPVYGDDSTFVDDTPSLGKFYVKLEHLKNYIMWGNSKLALNDTDFANIQRSLYGARLHVEDLTGQTKYGDKRTKLDAFVANPGTIGTRNVFAGSGSFYAFRNTDLLIGSEKLRVEIRDPNSGIVLKTVNLRYGTDYTINYIRGHVWLNEPLPSRVSGDTLVRSSSSSGNNRVYLVASYEYTPSFEDADEWTIGGRVSQWLGDYLKLGGSYQQQENAVQDYQLMGTDLTLKVAHGTYLKGEISKTEGLSGEEYLSLDAGFGSFQGINPLTPGAIDGEAMGAELAISHNDWFNSVSGSTNAYYRKKSQNFSAPGHLTLRDTTQLGGMSFWSFSNVVEFKAKYDEEEQLNYVEKNNLDLELKLKLFDRLYLAGGYRIDEQQSFGTGTTVYTQSGKRQDAAVEVGYEWDALKAYVFGQDTIDKDVGRLNNRRYGIGADWQVTQKAKIGGELSDGDGGVDILAKTEYLWDEKTKLYASYLTETSQSDAGLRVRDSGKQSGGFTVGTNVRYSDDLGVKSENRYLLEEDNAGLTHAFGVDYAPVKAWQLGFQTEVGDLKNEQNGQVTKRKSGAITVGYSSDKRNASLLVEAREDESSSDKRRTINANLKASQKVNDNWRFLFKGKFSDSKSQASAFNNADLLDLNFGAAFRPITNDAWNLLFKWRYYNFLPSVAQIQTGTNRTPEYSQKTHVFSFDVDYCV